jgi:hypothetical protein
MQYIFYKQRSLSGSFVYKIILIKFYRNTSVSFISKS